MWIVIKKWYTDRCEKKMELVGSCSTKEEVKEFLKPLLLEKEKRVLESELAKVESTGMMPYVTHFFENNERLEIGDRPRWVAVKADTGRTVDLLLEHSGFITVLDGEYYHVELE